MSAKKFKFVSPGVFINEIDNSFIPRTADTIGPAVIGRATRGIAMQPLTVKSYSEFVENFGETVPGNGGGDVYRDGNRQSPMYGLYAAKAFLRPNVAPLTYTRLLGFQHPDNDATAGAMSGWRTKTRAGSGDGGGAFGLFVIKSSSLGKDQDFEGTAGVAQTASLAAIWYLDGGKIELSGALYSFVDTAGTANTPITSAMGTAILSDTNGVFKARLVTGSGIDTTAEVINFSLDPEDRRYVRKVFNTNPQLVSSSGVNFYAPSLLKQYWLGETYEQESRDTLGSLSGEQLVGWIGNIALSSSNPGTNTPANMKGVNSTEAKAGWFISQHLDVADTYVPFNQQKLFRLKGRGHGEYLNKNLKVSISNIRKSNTSTTDYGSFSVIIRMLSDVDGAIQVVERFDNCSLNPSSPNYIARKIGDKYLQWSETKRRLEQFGDYPNQSKFVYVEMDSDVDAGATDPLFLPFGYFGPPKYKDVTISVCGDKPQDAALVASDGYYTTAGSGVTNTIMGFRSIISASNTIGGLRSITASLRYPDIRLRLSSSDGGTSDPDDCFFGIQTTRTANSNRFDNSTRFVNRLLNNSIGDDPTTQTIAGIDSFSYVFSLDDVVTKTGDRVAFYQSGSRVLGSSKSAVGGYSSLLEAGFDSFTAPFWGGFDGLDITKPDPFYNDGLPSTANEINNYAYYTLLRAIDSHADPEFVDMNMLVNPGLTNEGLTNRIIDICEARGDAMTLLDIDDAYIPAHEAYYSSKSARIPNTPQQIATKINDRGIDSSYAATFYPWVQTREEQNGQLVWIPPSVAMMGVLASSERKSHLWFAPAGFNRGGLSDGAAGIPITGVAAKLTSKERDTLYDANVNPIASFPSSGIVVFGQKTLQERQSALDRINVRRLVIFLKKQISIISTQVLFEQNVPTTWNRFKGLVEPFLANVRTNFGISDYRLILDESTTTPDLIDQNILYAKIMVKPARAIEFIAIDFVVASTGASFDD